MAASSTTTSDEFSSLSIVDENNVAKISDSNNNNNDNDVNMVDSTENPTKMMSNNTGSINNNNNNNVNNQQNSMKKEEKEKQGILKKTPGDGQTNGSAIQEQNAKDHNGHNSNGFINKNGENHRKLAQKTDNNAIASTEEILDVMERINRAVKAGQFSPTLASLIFKLCDYLKKNGENMENTHKNELNQTFVSIRQACCRDSGQLGTPCRLKMMELVELRAMKWMPNLSHSQYYMEKSASLDANGSSTTTTTSFENESIRSPPPSTSNAKSPGLIDARRSPKPPTNLVGSSPLAAPMQLPPTAAVFMSPGYHPFNFHHHRTSVGANDILAATGAALSPLNAAAAQTPPQPPSFYHLILAPGAPPVTFAAPGGGGAAAAGLLPTPTGAATAPLIHHPMAPNFSMPAAISPLTAAALNAKTMAANKLASKLANKGQFRDEVMIRNADSGKIMGVKGRRVSIIEELSGCIISFQKVAQEAKERTLTITGPNDESILHAKILIEDTIRRNVSPTRPGDPQPTPHHQTLIGTMSNDETRSSTTTATTTTTTPMINGDVGANGDEVECALNEMGSILKLSCADPNVLKVARQALNEYFQRRDGNNLNRRLSTGDVLRRHPAPAYAARERRKSMPLPLNILEEGVENPNDSTNGGIQPTTPKFPGENSDFETENSAIHQSKFGNALSTPSLFSFDKRPVLKSTSSVNENSTEGRTRIVYTRDYLLQCSSEVPLEKMPELSEEIREKMDEVVLENPHQFDGQIHKRKFALLKQYAHVARV